MKLSPTQRSFLFLGMVLAMALLPLVGGLHHHDPGEARGTCWFCTTASASTFPLLVLIIAVVAVRVPLPLLRLSAPCRFVCVGWHRRGPPPFSLA
jgi:uncharacterized membrane protein